MLEAEHGETINVENKNSVENRRDEAGQGGELG